MRPKIRVNKSSRDCLLASCRPKKQNFLKEQRSVVENVMTTVPALSNTKTLKHVRFEFHVSQSCTCFEQHKNIEACEF